MGGKERRFLGSITSLNGNGSVRRTDNGLGVVDAGDANSSRRLPPKFTQGDKWAVHTQTTKGHMSEVF